jgi:hypothetical protein
MGTKLTNAYTTISTFNSRNITDYGMLAIMFGTSTWIKQSTVIPVSKFKQITGCDLYYPSSNGTVEVDVKYKTDTSFDVKYIASQGADVYLYIYGIL